MRHEPLYDGVKTTQLGYGCASLMARPDDLGTLLAATATNHADAVVMFASRHSRRITAVVRAVEEGLPAGGMAVIGRLIERAAAG